MKNIIRNIKEGQGSSFGLNGYELARKIADEHQSKTGNACAVERILDYTDRYDGEPRYHYSFDVIEMLKD